MFNGRTWRVVRFSDDPRQAAEFQEATWDTPATGRVLIRVRAAGAGFPDLMMTGGSFPLLGDPPFGLGEEAAGEVVAVAPESRFGVGEHVAGITSFLQGWGGYGEYAYLVEQSTMRIPEGMPYEEAGGFPIAFRTAYTALVERAPVERGQSLLVLGAAGSSGAAATQLGKALGATVVAVASTGEKLEFCRLNGADHLINHRTEDLPTRVAEITDGRGVDVVYDPVGGETAAAAVRTLARYGRIAVVGLASGAPVPLDSLDLMLNNRSAVGVLSAGHTPDEDEKAWSALAGLAARKVVATPVGTVYDLADVPAMIAAQASPPPGKSVVRVRH
jgi:NADPH2:quinone reductase